jgi:DNA-binding NarL/FixJ family response regulator
MAVRILVIDDYKDWRKQIRLLLRVRPEWNVICEASDGFEGVQKAEELRPDLILLDIALPNLDGIESARRIRQVFPDSKIIFLTADSSLDVAEVALSTGVHGFVHKLWAGSQLLPAIDAVLRGDRFVTNTSVYRYKSRKMSLNS